MKHLLFRLFALIAVGAYGFILPKLWPDGVIGNLPAVSLAWILPAVIENALLLLSCFVLLPRGGAKSISQPILVFVGVAFSFSAAHFLQNGAISLFSFPVSLVLVWSAVSYTVARRYFGGFIWLGLVHLLYDGAVTFSAYYLNLDVFTCPPMWRSCINPLRR